MIPAVHRLAGLCQHTPKNAEALPLTACFWSDPSTGKLTGRPSAAHSSSYFFAASSSVANGPNSRRTFLPSELVLEILATQPGLLYLAPVTPTYWDLRHGSTGGLPSAEAPAEDDDEEEDASGSDSQMPASAFQTLPWGARPRGFREEGSLAAFSPAAFSAVAFSAAAFSAFSIAAFSAFSAFSMAAFSAFSAFSLAAFSAFSAFSIAAFSAFAAFSLAAFSAFSLAAFFFGGYWSKSAHHVNRHIQITFCTTRVTVPPNPTCQGLINLVLDTQHGRPSRAFTIALTKFLITWVVVGTTGSRLSVAAAVVAVRFVICPTKSHRH